MKVLDSANVDVYPDWGCNPVVREWGFSPIDVVKFQLKKYSGLSSQGPNIYTITAEVAGTKVKNLPRLRAFWRILRGRSPFDVVECRKSFVLRSFEDFEPKDPFVENNARECFDYLTKNYDIEKS